jgi:hypothetical protein
MPEARAFLCLTCERVTCSSGERKRSAAPEAIAVLIPLFFMGDVGGRLFREFAVTAGMLCPTSGWPVTREQRGSVGPVRTSMNALAITL